MLAAFSFPFGEWLKRSFERANGAATALAPLAITKRLEWHRWGF
jgi:hypothetical protein